MRRWADATKLGPGEIFDGCDSDTAFLRLAAADTDSIVTAPPSIRQSEPRDAAPSLPFGFLGAISHGTVGYFSSGWPVAYLVATVIFGIGLAVGAVVHVSEPVQLAKQPSPVTQDRMTPPPRMEFVGQITGMANCQFKEGSEFRVQGSGAENQRSEIRNQKSLVALGDKFILASGLMEITYDTGAKVIVQGPATYEAESRNGGFLSLGKLIGKVTSEAARGLTIRTPTAIVTDLGTEFGVEVSPQRESRVYVFRGKVKLGRCVAGELFRGETNSAAESESLILEEGAAPGWTLRVVRNGFLPPAPRR